MGTRRSILAFACALGLGAGVLAPSTGEPIAGATAHDIAANRTVPGEGQSRPRAVYTPGTEVELANRLDRDPYRAIFLEAHARHAARMASRTPGDPDKEAQKDMARAARWFAFEYAINRTVISGEIVPFLDAEARDRLGDQVEELLLGAYPRSRLAVAPPLGGWDRDIDTAGEILQWSGAFDTMLGAGYDFGGDDVDIANILIALTSELYRNYDDPATANGYTDLHQNNHRSKSGAAMATGAVVLADYIDPDDPDPSHDALAWFDTGVTLVDEVLRYVLVAGDGAYAEGTHYWRFTTETIAPYVGMWERLLGDESWTTDTGRSIPALHHTTKFALTQDWMLAMTLPDGALAPIDDANTRGIQHFGALPPLPNSDAYAWRWATAAVPYGQEGTVDLAVDSIVAYDDSRSPAPPAGSPTSFWPEGGNAVFRSDWGPDATLVIAQGEGPTASEFGRDSTGAGRFPQSHEHIEPGSFLMYAFGEALVLDPGYLSFGKHSILLAPKDHNMVLVDGNGPLDPLTSSFAWRSNPFGPAPQDGFASVTDTLDTTRIDTATVTSRYGGRGPGAHDITVERQFLFVDNRYLVMLDQIVPHDLDGESVELNWLLQGNGGGTSGGTFEATPAGGRWTQTNARVQSAIVTSAGRPSLSTVLEEHESPIRRNVEQTHEALQAKVQTDSPVRAVQVVVPSATSDDPPTITTSQVGDRLEMTIIDASNDRESRVVWDGNSVELLDRSTVSDDVVAWTRGSHLATTFGNVTAPGASSVGVAALPDGAFEVIAVQPTHDVLIEGELAGTGPMVAHGACSVARTDRTNPFLQVRPSAAAPFIIQPLVAQELGQTRPGAVAGVAAQRAELGLAVTLDGRESCDIDGDELTPKWSLVSAPAGSAWNIQGSETWQPTVAVDANGTYRVRLVVTDATGRESEPVEVEIHGGDRCFDERDDDLDGLFDGADPDCDGVEPRPAADGVGFFLPKHQYLDAITANVDAAEVQRDHRGTIRQARLRLEDGQREYGVNVFRVGRSELYLGRIVLDDPAQSLERQQLWIGTIEELWPGFIVGVDLDTDVVWVIDDRSSSGH